MTAIEVIGLPESVKMPKLLFTMRGILNGRGLRTKFWITELADMRGCNRKEVKIEFPSYKEAVQAVDILDNYMFYVGKRGDQLNARLLSAPNRQRSPSPMPSRGSYLSRSRSRGHSYDRYSPIRDRSRSPLYREKTKLDLELELLRKKRMVIEEERRLLLEQKKLDLIREYGVSATRDLDSRERSRDRRQRPRREVKQEEPPARKPWPKLRPEKLPKFVMPTRILMAEMKPIIKLHAKPTAEERIMLDKLIITELRKRIALELQDKGYTSTAEIVKLYRNKYPIESDQALIEKLINNVRSSYFNLRDGNAGKQEDDKKVNEKQEIPEQKNVDPVPDSSTTTAADLKDDPKPVQTDPPIKVEPVIKDEVDASISSFEARLEDAADEDWIQDGIDWNDEESEGGQEHPSS